MMDSETAADIKRHFDVVAEGLRADIRVVIEGLAANTNRLERVETRLTGSKCASTGSKCVSIGSTSGSMGWRPGSADSRR
ncbi:MAG TPA: hypothetical protein VGA31_03510 [Thermoanaerobaculia bacterium]